MNSVDKAYLSLAKDILENGVVKETRSGRVKSVFGRQLRFNLMEEFPLLTTKKVYTKGVIHELLWFLQRPYNSHGSTNIEYLLKNNVNIWNDDAFRWHKQWLEQHVDNANRVTIRKAIGDDDLFRKPNGFKLEFEDYTPIGMSKAEFLNSTYSNKGAFLTAVFDRIELSIDAYGDGLDFYRYGDLGPVYGAQWRDYDFSGTDQIQNIIDTLRNNPNDRRMLCIAYNPMVLNEVALPPCHVMFQFYATPLTDKERIMYGEKHPEYSVMPEYGLSCMWTQRSCDFCLGVPFNISSYATLTYMIAKLVGMVPYELVGSLGDCHIYEAHTDAINEQLSRNGSDIVPQLKIKGNQDSIDDFRFEDFEIMNYYPDSAIKAPLLVG